MGLNKMLVIGNLGGDPEMRYMPNGDPVTSFSVATNRRYTTRDGEQREETEWFRVTTWRQLAEQCNQYLTKGRRVYVEGRLKTSTWTGQDGQTRITVEIDANQVVFLDSGPMGQGGEGGPGGEGGEGDMGAEPPTRGKDDLPW
jgi:single-strand DNA-binding protein